MSDIGLRTLLLCGAAAVAVLATVLLGTSADLHTRDHPHVDGMVAVVNLSVPAGKDARSTALLIAGNEGWTAEHAARSKRLSELHTLVIGIDGASLVESADGNCNAAVQMLPGLATHFQSETNAFARMPVLSALPGGSALAVLAARSTPARFKGLVTEAYGDPSSLCSSTTQISDLDGKAPIRWLDIVPDGMDSATAGLAGVKSVQPEAGLRKAFYRSYLGVAGTDSAFDLGDSSREAELSDLPLTIHPTPKGMRSDTYAIFLSGDGGWAKFDEEISNLLAQQGIPVVGISTLRYLWREKTPKQIAHDIARIHIRYQRRFKTKHVMLVGFSLGANVTPFYVRHLPEPIRADVSAIGLIAPETKTGFEIVVGGWLGRETGAHPVRPEIARLSSELPNARVACLYGDEETTTPCPGLLGSNIVRLPFEGGHHLGKSHERIASALTALTANHVEAERLQAVLNAEH